MKYVYYVSYAWVDGTRCGFGCSEVSCNAPISSMEEVCSLREKSKSAPPVSSGVTLLNWILLRTEESSIASVLT